MDYFKIYSTLDSTNKEAHRLLAEGHVQHGLTLFTANQTHGRGQFGRSWLSEPGSHMAISIIYKPAGLKPSDLPTLNMKISLGIVHALKAIDQTIHPLIKWPNDLYVHGKKLSGILIENSLSGGRVQHSVIGIGMNINEDHFPAEIPNAVSLYLLTQTKYDPQKVALLIREKVLSILDDEPPDWKNEYDAYLFGRGNVFTFISGDEPFEAEVVGVSLDGHLILKTPGENIQSFGSHEVKWKMS